MVDSNTRMQLLEQQLSETLASENPVSKRDKMINELVDTFNTEAETDSYITMSLFRRYEELFDSKLREQFLQHKLSTEEIDRLQKLSSEFYRLINPQRPIHIVDDVTHQEVCPPLPPIFMKLNFLTGEGARDMDRFHAAHENDDHNEGGIAQLNKRKATVSLTRRIAAAQDIETIDKSMRQYDALAFRFEQEALGKYKSVEKQGDTPDNVNQAVSQKSSDDPSDLFSFEMDEDD